MRKTITTFSVDSEILALAKQKFPNRISTIINDFLKMVVTESNVSSESILSLREKISETKKKLELLENQLARDQARLAQMEQELLSKVAVERQKVKEQWQQAKLTAERVRRSGLLEEIAE